MTGNDQYKPFGVYVSRPVADALATAAYEEAGVVDLAAYFDPDATTIPAGDPGAEMTADLLEAVVANFAGLYDAADFESARRIEPDGFELVHLAARPGTIASARERFQAAATIQETDLRTVQTAIFAAWLSEDGQSRP